MARRHRYNVSPFDAVSSVSEAVLGLECRRVLRAGRVRGLLTLMMMVVPIGFVFDVPDHRLVYKRRDGEMTSTDMRAI